MTNAYFPIFSEEFSQECIYIDHWQKAFSTDIFLFHPTNTVFSPFASAFVIVMALDNCTMSLLFEIAHWLD